MSTKNGLRERFWNKTQWNKDSQMYDAYINDYQLGMKFRASFKTDDEVSKWMFSIHTSQRAAEPTDYTKFNDYGYNPTR